MVASEHGTAQGRTSYQDEHNDDCRSFAKSGGRIGNCYFRAERRFIPLMTVSKEDTNSAIWGLWYGGLYSHLNN